MQIELTPDFKARLRQALRRAGRREIGGMLFAEQLAPAHFQLIDFSLDLFSGSYTHFRRDPCVHQQALNEFFEKTGRDFSRFNYLGEWHSHPSFSVTPSIEDIETMQSLVENRTGAISFALLLIVRLRFRFWMDCSLTTFVCGYPPQPVRISAKFNLNHPRTENIKGMKAMQMLRYYGKGSIDKRLNSILETIKEVHGIPSEVLDISRHGTYDPRQEQQAYERDFKPRAKLLKKRTGHPITSLRSRRARNYFVSTPGTLAIVGAQGIEWYTLGEDNISEFLSGVLAEGPSRLEELCSNQER